MGHGRVTKSRNIREAAVGSRKFSSSNRDSVDFKGGGLHRKHESLIV